MSNGMKVLLVLLVVVAGGGAYYQFVYSKETPAPAEDMTLNAAAQDPNCDPAATDPNAGAAATDPAATDPNAGAAGTDPNAGAAATDPNAGAAGTDPTATAPAAGTAARGADPDVIVADGAYEPGYASDGVIRAAEAGTAVDPAAVGTSAPVDPATQGNAVTDPAAAGAAVDPNAGAAVDPNAGAAVDPNAAGANPCPDTGATPTDQSAMPDDPSAGGGAGGGGGGKTGSPSVPPIVTGDGTNTGNNNEALRTSVLVNQIAMKNQLAFVVDTMLFPVDGGQAVKKKPIAKYRKLVSAAVMRIKVADDTSMQQWTTSTKKTRTKSVNAFLSLLGKLYPSAQRSVTIVGTDDKPLATGDASLKGEPKVKLVG